MELLGLSVNEKESVCFLHFIPFCEKIIESIKMNVLLIKGRADRLFMIVRNGEKRSCSVRLIAKVFGLIVTSFLQSKNGPLIHK